MSVQLVRFLGNIFVNGTLPEWDASDEIPEDKKVLITEEGHEKIGDGVHLFKDLPFIYHSSMYQTSIDHTTNLTILNAASADHETRIGTLETYIPDMRLIPGIVTTLNKAVNDITSLNTLTTSHTSTLTAHTNQITSLTTNLNAHVANTDNPHHVTAEQVGAPTLTAYNDLSARVTTNSNDIANLKINCDTLLNVPVVPTATNITLEDGHRGKCIRMSTGSTINIPVDTSAPLLVPGSTITILNRSTDNVTIAPATGTTLGWIGENLYGRRLLNPMGMATLYKDAENSWIISGIGVE